jgi:glutamyl-tRNA synthetase
MNEVVAEQQIKFPKLAMPLRVMLTGGAQSPSIDQVMFILGRETALQRIQAYLR